MNRRIVANLTLAIGCFVLFIQLSLPGAFAASDASEAWREILSKCARSNLIGDQSLFFGVSNSIGPGSVWRFADDKSIRLMFELSDAFPDAADQARLIAKNNVATCSGDSSFGWDVKLGLPFSTSLIPLSIDLRSVLEHASKITVSVNGFAVDVLKETPWKQAFRTLAVDNPYRVELAQPNRVIAANVVKVTGLKAAFVFGTSLSAEIRALFFGKIFSLARAVGNGGSEEKGAVLHAGVSDANTITMVADGPFYLLAAYSMLLGGIPIGVDAGSAPLVLAPALLPEGVVVGSGR